MRAWLSVLGIWLATGCGAPNAPTDAGSDAASTDAGLDGGDDDGDDAASDDTFDGGDDASDDAGDDASDDAASDDTSDDVFFLDACAYIGPNAPDSGIARTWSDAGRAGATPIAPFTSCAISMATDTFEGREHDPECFPIPYPYEPPSAGPHYPYPYPWGTYDAAIPWGYAVHDLEHGGVILAYHCANDADCDPVRAEFDAITAMYPIDDCTTRAPTAPLFIIVPDPTLPVPIAAIAWQTVYEATCLDPPSLEAFVAAHYNMGPEDFVYTFPDGGSCLL